MKEEIEISREKLDKDQKALLVYMAKIQDKKNYADFPELDHNPFICSLSDDIAFKKINKGIEYGKSVTRYANMETGNISTAKTGIMFAERKLVDSGKFTKVYANRLKDVFELSSTALKLFGYFITEFNFKNDQDIVYMNMQEGMEFCGYTSRSMVYRGLSELIIRGFICKTSRPWMFFVNPNYAFNGDRIRVFTEYVLDTSDYFNAEKSKKGNTQKLLLEDYESTNETNA